MNKKKYLRLALPCPLKTTFDYLPADTTQDYQVGMRCVVSFGRQRHVGIIIDIVTQTTIAIEKLKPVEVCLDLDPVLSEELLSLGQWIAQYYQVAIGEVLHMMLPPVLRKAVPAVEKITSYKLNDAGRSAFSGLRANAKKQRQLMQYLLSENEVSELQLVQVMPHYHATLRYFIEKKWLDTTISSPQLLLPVNHLLAVNQHLQPQQQAAVASLIRKHTFQVNVLEGITGSGKTEVYLEAAKDFLRRGLQILILVPEIGLTPQLVTRIENYLGIQVTTIHSQLSNKARIVAWQRAMFNQVQIIVGTRTALFTPLPYLGLIIIDEEHDASLRSRDKIRYSARDSAIIRAHLLNIPIILASATPTLETLHNINQGRYQAVQLTKRAIGELPQWRIIDANQQPIKDGLSAALVTAISERLLANEQVILFLNRRGFSPVLYCTNCAWMAECQHCDARLTWHQKMYYLKCHHCGATQRVPEHCPQCQHQPLLGIGTGTQRVESALQEHFPQETIVRFDRDQIHHHDDFMAQCNDISSGRARLILGTQMLAKGHDFPNVTLVGILESDALLFSRDFRGEERLAQLLMQVSGRGGRSHKAAEVLIQTYHPQHAIFSQLPKQGYHEYAQSLLMARQELGLPPFSHQALILAESKQAQASLRYLEKLQRQFSQDYADLFSQLEIMPAMPSTMERRQHYYRAYFVIQANKRHLIASAIKCLEQYTALKPYHVRLMIEIDPPDFH